MFEKNLEQSMFSNTTDKTFVDKILARQDVEAIREIIKKPRLKREELLDILYLIGSTESKLLNYSEWDRYVILKFFVWIREFVKVIEQYYDFEDNLKQKENKCRTCKNYRGTFVNKDNGLSACTCNTFVQDYKMNKRTYTLLDDTARLMEHNAKFLIDLYLNVGRTSLSVGATGLMELLKNKYELVYPNQQIAQQPNNSVGGILALKR